MEGIETEAQVNQVVASHFASLNSDESPDSSPGNDAAPQEDEINSESSPEETASVEGEQQEEQQLETKENPEVEVESKNPKTEKRIQSILQERNVAREEATQYKQKLEGIEAYVQSNREVFELVDTLLNDESKLNAVMSALNGWVQPSEDDLSGLDPRLAEAIKKQEATLKQLMDRETIREKTEKERQEFEAAKSRVSNLEQSFSRLCEDKKISTDEEKQFLSKHIWLDIFEKFAPDALQKIAVQVSKQLPDGYLEEAFLNPYTSLEKIRTSVKKSLSVPSIPITGGKNGVPAAKVQFKDEREVNEAVARAFRNKPS